MTLESLDPAAHPAVDGGAPTGASSPTVDGGASTGAASPAKAASPALAPARGADSKTAFRLLMHVRIQSIFSSMGLYGKHRGGAVALTILSSMRLLLIVLSVVAIFSLLGALLTFIDPHSAPALAVTVGSAVSFVFTIVQAGGSLFGQRDLDFRMTLPISTRAMTMSQISAFFIYQLLWSIIIMLPMCISYLAMVPSSTPQIAFMLAAVILTPMVPVSVGVLIAFALSVFSSRFKYSSIVYVVLGMAASVLIYVAFVAMYMQSGSSSAQGGQSTPMLDVIWAIRLVAFAYPPSAWVGAAMQGAIIEGVAFIVLSLAIPALLVEVFSRFYLKINSIVASRTSGHSVELSLASSHSSTPLKAMVKMEFKRILSIPQYAINSMFGDVMMIVLAIVIAVLGVSASVHGVVVSYMGMDEGAASAAADYIAVAVPWVVAFFGAMSTSASCAVSVEGRQAWIMVTAPLETKDILAAKIWTNMLYVGVFVVACALILCIAGVIDPVCGAETVLLACGFAFLNSCLGVMVDAKSPNYSWVKPADVVKRSKGIMAVSIAGLVEILVGVCVVIVMSVVAGQLAGELATVAIAAASIVGGIAIFRKAGKHPIYAQ